MEPTTLAKSVNVGVNLRGHEPTGLALLAAQSRPLRLSRMGSSTRKHPSTVPLPHGLSVMDLPWNARARTRIRISVPLPAQARRLTGSQAQTDRHLPCLY